MAKTAIVIGGGVGGLCAAIRLAARGIRVTLLEKNARLGGKLNLWAPNHPNRPADRPFKFDTGPSLLTIPLIFQDLFSDVGEDVRNYLPLVKLDPIARFSWGDGTTFELRADEAARLAEVSRISPRDVAGFKRLLAKGESIWNLSADTFLFHAPEQVLRQSKFDLLAGLRLVTAPFRIGMFSNFAKLIDRHIRSEKLRQVLYQYATYSGASPFKAPATLAVIPFVEMVFGAWYIPGGMYKLAEGLEQLARKVGVEIRTQCAVEKILVEANGNAKPQAVGVAIAGVETLRADAIIANSDVVYTYRNLIDARFRKRYNDASLDKIEPGGSGLVLMLGVDGKYPQLAHHNKFMPDDYTSDLRAMFETHTVPADPCIIYVCASSRTDPTQAPEGCENLFILASAPALHEKTRTDEKTRTHLVSNPGDNPPVDQGRSKTRTQLVSTQGGGIDWKTEGPRYRDQLIRTLETKWGLTDLSKRIVVERMMTPMDLKTTYNANAGSIYGIGSNSRRNAFLRPPNRDKDIAGLYFAGGATHPGGGLPLVALSGKIVSELVAGDLLG